MINAGYLETVSIAKKIVGLEEQIRCIIRILGVVYRGKSYHVNTYLLYTGEWNHQYRKGGECIPCIWRQVMSSI